MIFLAVFGLIAFIVIVLNFMDSSNLEKIENHLKSQGCQNIVYSKGVYKAICDDKVVQISNSFNVDLEKNKTSFKLDKIKNMDDRVLTIILNESYEIDFKEEQNKEEFYNRLKEKVDR